MTFEETYLPKGIPEAEGLISLGFVQDKEGFFRESPIMDGAFRLHIRINGDQVKTRLIETETGEPYELYRIESAHGEYVGAIRDEVKSALLEIKARCYPVSWTKMRQPREILDWIHESFDEKEEYPWAEYGYAVVRRKDNQKWYALFMLLPVAKIGIDEDREEVIMNIAHDGGDVDHKVFYPAYHMNKKSWVSMVLDGSVPTEDVKAYIAQSRESAAKGKKRKE